jgi:E3 ubiquitin-protein ligase MARCH6
MASDDAATATARLLDEMHNPVAGPHDEPVHDGQSSSLKHTERDEADTCRICRGEGSADEPLFYPCKCSGSIKYVHQECLMEWLSHTQKKHCELCKTSFRFTKLYHPGMPNRIPTTVFVRRAAMHVVNIFLTWCRAVLVACVWLLLLPWCMRVVWRSLFWVGDGGWSRDMYLDATETVEKSSMSPFNMTTLQPSTDTAAASPNTNYTQNAWAPFFPISFTAHNASAKEPALWTFAMRLLFGFPLPLASLSISMSEANRTTTNATSDPLGLRSPSLLSDVPFFNWFDSQTANRFIIDVLEGQIITLLVVVAFILIFLIREWVVQQQPVINMVALGDNAAGHRAADHPVELPHAVAIDEDNEEEDLHHRGGHMEVVNDAALFVDQDDQDAPGLELERHHSASPPRQGENDPSHSDNEVNATEPRTAPVPDSVENILDAASARFRGLETTPSFVLEAGSSESENMSFPLRSSSLSQSADVAEGASESELPASLQRPIMPDRDSSFMAMNIRRTLEEGNDWSFENVPQPSQPESSKTHTIPTSWEDEGSESRRLGLDTDPASDQEQDSEHSSESWQQVANVAVEHDSDQVLEGDRPQNKGKAKATDSGSVPPDVAVAENDNHETAGTVAVEEPAAEVIVSSVKSESGSESSFDFSDSGDENQPPQEVATSIDSASEVQEPQADATAPPLPLPLPRAQPTLLDQVLDWMFGDVAPALAPTEEPRNDEHIVRNLAEEAPFVPFAGNEPQQPADPQDQAQNPEVVAAAAQAGVELNDQEAIEDAEDLEGILELIGMQGPIVGLFQNVLFSAVLISATLACAVWLPYLWGKVVILFMGSPIALLIKLPLQIIATLTDLIVDFALLVMAGMTYWGSKMISTLIHLCATGSLPQQVDSRLATTTATMRTLAEGALDRIAKMLAESPLSPRPDYFRLSVNSHMALRGLQNSTSSALNETGNFVNTFIEQASADSPIRFLWRAVIGLPYILSTGSMWLYAQCNALLSWIWTSRSYKITLDVDLGHNINPAYTSLERWTASDRLIAIFAGYAFFAVAGAVYLKRGSPFSTSQQGQRIERIISDVLSQAGGVLKVILIISIEMLVFPLYCGLLLDLAMLPLFQSATPYTRWQFACGSPWTSGFVHWFIGTCYMFHFALFVSMCRKIMRKGVLYFIRDPDDPTFHPVRDVLERSVTTQLRKIAFSALVYGALVIVCLGGVVWTLSRATSGVLPIHWTTEAPSLEFPLDLLFYNFLTPVIIKFYKPSESIHAVYKWCFMKCAGFLRLSSFLFGDTIVAEDGDGGRYVRAPASDQARVPKGQPVFVEVDKENVRKDGITEGGVHNTNLVAMVYIPNWFRVRIFAFVVTIWILMGMSGVGVTILPLLFGRYLFSFVLPDTVEMNDIHAFSLGIYTLGSIAYSAYHAGKFISNLQQTMPSPLTTLQTIATTASHVSLRALRFTYVWAAIVFAIPFLFAILIELYFLMPIHAYLGPSEPHVVHLIQDWTLGFLYSRIAARVIFANRQSRPARAFNAVIRDGYLYPNARIATRCFLLPVLAIWSIAIAIPSSIAWTTSRTLYAGATEQTRNMVWRFSYPAVGLSLVAMWASKEAIRMLTRWRLVVRDEVYLIGERLHNFGEKKAPVQSRATEEAITAASLAAGPEGVVG